MRPDFAELEQRSNRHGTKDLLDAAQAIGREMVAIDLDQSLTGHSLAVGLAGYSLFSACLARVSDPQNLFSDFSIRCLQKIAVELPQTDRVYPGLFTGLSGIAWVTRTVSELLESDAFRLDESDDEVLEFVAGYLGRDTEYEYDLINGLAGIGMWALTIPDELRRSEIVTRTLDLLENSAELTPEGGLTWRTPLVRERQFGRASQSVGPEYNLGLAHGVPGIVGFLALCVECRVRQDRAEDLLRKVLQWLRAQMSEGLSAFAITAGTKNPSRAAWCYGDPGVSLVLHRAARVLKCDALKELARAVSSRFCARRIHNSTVNDASLCHGSAGLSLICQRICAYDPSESTETARTYWLAELLSRRDHIGVSGFPYWNGLLGQYESTFSFLNGGAGVGLTLLAQADQCSKWSYPILIGY